jgi:hypothetical protein
VEIRPVIASYTGESYRAIRARLDDDALRLIARVAESPVPAAELDRGILAELAAMHVLAERDGIVRLDTSVFLREDIERINAAVAGYGRELATLIADDVAAMRDEPPSVTTFIVGVIGTQQSLGEMMRERGLTVDWGRFEGRYARSKVDFHEVCDAQDALEPDLLNKNVLRGTRYTAALIGPGGGGYPVWGGADMADYYGAVNAFLTDAYAMLLTGELENAALRLAAERAGLIRDGRPEAPVIDREAMDRYEPTIRAVGHITASYYAGKLEAMRDLLASTTAGRQGVPPENMMLNLWRYVRRAVARALYDEGILRDRLPETGLTMVFYANDVAILDRMFG